MPHLLSRIIPIMLALVLCAGTWGDTVTDLVSAARTKDNGKIDQALGKLVDMPIFPDAKVSAALKQAHAACAREADPKKKPDLQAVVFVLLNAISMRGGFGCVEACIALVGEGEDLAEAADRTLGRLTCHMIPAEPKLPAGAKNSDNPAINRMTAWSAWWKTQKNRAGVKNTDPQGSVLITEGLTRKGIKIPNQADIKPQDIDRVISELLRGCAHELEYVRHWSSLLLMQALQKEFPFLAEDGDEGRRDKIIAEMKSYWDANKQQILKQLSRGR